jgi:hypothetical protein
MARRGLVSSVLAAAPHAAIGTTLVEQLEAALPGVVVEGGPDLVALQLDVPVVGHPEADLGGPERPEGLRVTGPEVVLSRVPRQHRGTCQGG